MPPPRYVPIEEAVEEAILLAEQQNQQQNQQQQQQPPITIIGSTSADAAGNGNSNGNRSHRQEFLSEQQQEQQQRRNRSKRRRSDAANTGGAGGGEDVDAEVGRRPPSRSLFSAANVVAVVTDVSVSQTTGNVQYVWIQDESLLAAERRRCRHPPNQARPRQAAAVAYWQPAHSSAGPAGSPVATKGCGPQRTGGPLREGDVVALHGLVLRTSCLRLLLQDRRLCCRGSEKNGGASAAEETGDISPMPPPPVFEFAHDANAMVFRDDPRLEKVRLLAHVDADADAGRVQWYDHDDRADRESPLGKRAAELVRWYLARCRALDGTRARANPSGAANDWAHCRRRSVAELQAGGGRASLQQQQQQQISHLVARVAAVQEHSALDAAAIARRKLSLTSMNGKHKQRRHNHGEVRSAAASCAAVTFVLLKDSTSDVPVPLVLIGKNNAHKFRDRLADLMSQDAGRDEQPEKQPGERWFRWTRLATVRMRDVLGGAGMIPDHHEDENAVALVPTDATTVSLVPGDQEEEVFDLQRPATLGTSQPTQMGSAGSSAAAAMITVEAPIASIRICAGSSSTATAGVASSLIVLDAANVEDNISRTLEVLRQHERWRGAKKGKRSTEVQAGGCEDVTVSITLGSCVAAATSKDVTAVRVHPPPFLDLTARWHVVQSLFWGGARRESFMNGDLDEICCRMVSGMLVESVRFAWILERQERSDTDGNAPYCIVDVSLRQL